MVPIAMHELEDLARFASENVQAMLSEDECDLRHKPETLKAMKGGVSCLKIR